MLGNYNRDRKEWKHHSRNRNKSKKRKPLRQYIPMFLLIMLMISIIANIALGVWAGSLNRKVKILVRETTLKQDNQATVSLPEDEVACSEQPASQEDSLALSQEDILIEADIASFENQDILNETFDKSNVWNSNSGMHKVYLTFDDGPSNNTDAILDILDEYGVKATFFVVGKEGYEEQYQRIVKEGHTLGMHSFSHKYREIYQSVDNYSADLKRIQSFLYEVTGVESKIVRFPGGSSNTVSEVSMQELIRYVDNQGITYFDWNISSGDAKSRKISAKQITDNVLKKVNRYNTSIVLLHDSADKDTTVEALPTIIEKILESDNTVLLPISEGTYPVQHVQAECQ